MLRKESWWILALALLLFLSMQNIGQKQSTDGMLVPYSQFMDAVKDGQIQKVEIPRDLDGNVIATLKDGKHWQTIAPHDIWMVGDLYKNKVEIVARNPEKPNPMWQFLMAFGPALLIVGIWVYMMKKSASGGGILGGVKKNPAKKAIESTTKFADVAGVDEAKAEVEQFVDFLKDPAKYQTLGGKIPKGILLVGDPGTGKTLLAKAIAGEAGVPFYSAAGSDFVEMFVGVGAARIRDMFDEAKKNAPCIIFIDEIDAVGRKRSNSGFGGNSETENTLNQLLVEMDGFEGNTGIIIMASTNRVDMLDNALLRPGRFDRHVVVPKPDLVGRAQILRVHAAKIPLAPDVNLDIVARGTPGFAGADLANLLNEAALFAGQKLKRLVDMNDIELAKDKIMMGAERKNMKMSDADKRVTAYHEAGHAAVGIVMGDDPVHKVSIVPRGRALGVTMHLPQEDRYSASKSHYLAHLAMLMGGRAAEEIFIKEITTGASNDMMRATEIATLMVTEWGMSDSLGPMHYGSREGNGERQISPETRKKIDAEVRQLVENAYAQACAIMEKYREPIEEMVKKLMDKETIDSRDVESCFPEDIQQRARALWKHDIEVNHAPLPQQGVQGELFA